MKTEKVLEKLEELLRGWGLSKNDWVFTGEYAWGLQGYKFKPRKGHLDIFVDRKKLPWEVGKLDASAFPPKNSLELKQLRKFIKRTKFAPHFLPLPIGTAKWQTIEKKVRQAQLYTLPNKRKIRIHIVSKLLKDRAEVLLKTGIHIWDEPKIRRWLKDFNLFKRFAEKKNDKKTIKICERVLEKCKKIRKRTRLKPKKEKISSEISQIKGNIAYKGKVKGKVEVIANIDQLSKFRKGKILVTPMTTPDFIVAIEKAKAIVTDEGGVGCHAAIISREFKIPCIMGTKIATQVLKDGDLVEVDANRGIVRILK